MVKTALITGGASGIGKACVEKMAREGYGVVIADVNLDAGILAVLHVFHEACELLLILKSTRLSVQMR